MDRAFVQENARERERLKKMVKSLTDDELKLVIYKEGWTFAVVLAHVAFWDNYGLAKLRRWQQSGVATSRSDSDAVNDALQAIALVMPPRTAAELAVSSAEAVDREILALSPDFIKAVEALNEPYRLNRGFHRKMHLDEIEAFLKNRCK